MIYHGDGLSNEFYSVKRGGKNKKGAKILQVGIPTGRSEYWFIIICNGEQRLHFIARVWKQSMPRYKDEPPGVRVYTVCDESRSSSCSQRTKISFDDFFV